MSDLELEPGVRHRVIVELLEQDGVSAGLPWVYHDGGRAAAGFRGHTGDCTTRAIAIATGTPYREVYDALNARVKAARKGSKAARGSARTGVSIGVIKAHLAEVGWDWNPTMGIGTGTTTHLRPLELPDGPLIARVTKHLCAVIDGVVYDTGDPCRDGERAVYGYWSPSSVQG